MMTTKTATKARIPAVKRVTRSDRNESTVNVLLYIKCSKMAARMLHLVLSIITGHEINVTVCF